MKRLEGWETRLIDFLGSRRREPFAWGSNDCCLFAADAVAAMTGADPARKLRGYKTVRGASFRLARHGGVYGCGKLCADAFGYEEIGVNFATRGDVLVVTLPDGSEALGVMDLDGAHVLVPGPDGLLPYPKADANVAWRVG